MKKRKAQTDLAKDEDLSAKRANTALAGLSEAADETPTFELPRVKVTTQPWSELTQSIVEGRGAVLEHQYVVSGPKKKKPTLTLSTTHTHGDFNTKVADDKSLQKNNVSTSVLGGTARSFSKLWKAFPDDPTGATDTLRVLKGTHISKGLTGSTQDAREAAVEMGAEIGISEYSRGSNSALSYAAVNLYRVKRGKLTGEGFANPAKGYLGAGDGGAQRLRAHTDVYDAFRDHAKDLVDIYKNYASQKAKRPWETGLKKGATAADKFKAWVQHKNAKWQQRK
jgi:hypothetical protein